MPAGEEDGQVDRRRRWIRIVIVVFILVLLLSAMGYVVFGLFWSAHRPVREPKQLSWTDHYATSLDQPGTVFVGRAPTISLSNFQAPRARLMNVIAGASIGNDR